MKLFRVVAEVENENEFSRHLHMQLFGEEIPYAHVNSIMVGGMAAFDLPGVTAPNYKGHKGGAFWYTAAGWKAFQVARAIAAESKGKGFNVTVKVIKVRKSDVIWTDGIQAIVRKS